MAEIEGLVRALREGDDAAKTDAAWRLGDLVCHSTANKVAIAEAGGIPLLVDVVRNGSPDAKRLAAAALCNLARNNDANAVAIATAVGLEALVQLARRGRVNVDDRSVVGNAGIAAKRKAALVVAALLRACVPDEARSRADVRDVIRGVVGPYL